MLKLAFDNSKQFFSLSLNWLKLIIMYYGNHITISITFNNNNKNKVIFLKPKNVNYFKYKRVKIKTVIVKPLNNDPSLIIVFGASVIA